MSIATGTKLGQYEVQEFIGQGAMGLVYRAYHVQLELPGAVKVLRGRAAIPDLVEALHSKDDSVMFESLTAIEKIRDPSAAPRIAFLLRDLDEKIQITTLETTGVLANKEAAPEVRDALGHARTIKVRRAALTTLAMLAVPADHGRVLPRR